MENLAKKFDISAQNIRSNHENRSQITSKHSFILSNHQTSIIEHLTRKSRPSSLITGRPGTGKSVLIRALVNTLRSLDSSLLTVHKPPIYDPNQQLDIHGLKGGKLATEMGKTSKKFQSRSGFCNGVAVCAPTGLSALNIGGMTLHSFFDLQSLVWSSSALKYPSGHSLKLDSLSPKLLTRLRSLKTLVIDEVSMVNPWILDWIHLLLDRHCGGISYGIDAESQKGVQVILCGDLMQLPPIPHSFDGSKYFGSEAEKSMDSRFQVQDLTQSLNQLDISSNPKRVLTKESISKLHRFCFDAKSWHQYSSNTVKLNQVYRQNMSVPDQNNGDQKLSSKGGSGILMELLDYMRHFDDSILAEYMKSLNNSESYNDIINHSHPMISSFPVVDALLSFMSVPDNKRRDCKIWSEISRGKINKLNDLKPYVVYREKFKDKLGPSWSFETEIIESSVIPGDNEKVDPVSICALTSETETINLKKLKELNRPIFEYHAIDGMGGVENKWLNDAETGVVLGNDGQPGGRVQYFMGQRNFPNDFILHSQDEIPEVPSTHAATKLSLHPKLSLSMGARVMLTRNLDFDRGLVNGSLGNVCGFRRVKGNYLKFQAEQSESISRVFYKSSLGSSTSRFGVLTKLPSNAPSFVNENSNAPKCQPNSQYSLILPVIQFDQTDGQKNRVLIRPWLEHEFGDHVYDDPTKNDLEKFLWRSQLPLRLAYAQTIHKIQGQTLPKVKIYLRNIFTYGQLYVALSRVKSLENVQIIGYRDWKWSHLGILSVREKVWDLMKHPRLKGWE